MEKNPLKITDGNAKPKKNMARVSFSGGAGSGSAGDRAILHAIRRRKTINSATRLYDESLPDDVRSLGLISRHPKLQIPHIEQTHLSELSPFVLELRANVPMPEQLIAEDSYTPAPLNFLTNFVESSNDKPAHIVDTTNDLVLSADEVNRQLGVSFAGGSRPSPTMRFLTSRLHNVFPSRSHKHLESIPLHISRNDIHVSADAFIPKLTPENLMSYFDLPEDESAQEEETEEIFELADLVASTQNETQDVPLLLPLTKGERTSSFRWPRFSFAVEMPVGWQRAIGGFVLASFVFVLPLHAMQVLNQLRSAKTSAQSNGEQALASLKAAAGANLVTNPSAAGASFSRASEQFGQADQAIKQLGGGVQLLLSTLGPTQKTYKTNAALLTVGEELSIAGSRVSDGLAAMQQELSPTPSSRVQLLTLYLTSAIPHLEAAQKAMLDVDANAIDESNRQTFTQLQTSLPTLVDSTKEFLALSDTVQSIMGTNGTKRYLLIFQNNTEIRPTGGFMGSFAELSVHNGLMDSLTVPGGGTYDLQGQLRTSFVSPWPLQLLSAKWQFQDANWFPDFPTSARQMIQFYKDAGGSDVDGVIAINANFVTDLLGLLGPVDMPEYGRIIDQNNFLLETQKIVENEYDKTENKPKAFIGDLAPKLIEKALHKSPETFLDLANHVQTGLAQKEIQMYFNDDATERTIRERGWSGEIKATDKDYLMLIDTNLGGGKTDGVMEEKINVDVNINSAGTIENTVTITRTHKGVLGEEFTGEHNVNYLRLYVPNGSKLLTSSGFIIPAGQLFETPDPSWIVDPDLQYADDSFSIDQVSGTQTYTENGKTVFGNWTQTKPGETTTVQFTYALPFNLSNLLTQNPTTETIRSLLGIPKTNTYSLLVQKQSGVIDRTTIVNLHIPDSLHTLWSSSDLAQIHFGNNTDGFLGMLLEEK